MKLDIKKIREKAKRRDKIAALLIRIGGILVIGTVITMLLLILRVSLPLFQAPSISVHSTFSLSESESDTLALGIGDYAEVAYAIGSNGVVTFVDPRNGVVLAQEAVAHPAGADNRMIASVEQSGAHRIALVWEDNSVSIIRIRLTPQFDSAGNRSIDYAIMPIRQFQAPSDANRVPQRVRVSDEGATLVALDENGQLRVTMETEEESLFGDVEISRSEYTIPSDLPGVITAIALDESGRSLYAGTDEGYLGWWQLGSDTEPERLDVTKVFQDGEAVSTLQLVFGDVSIAVGGASGLLSTWFPVRTPDDGSTKRLEQIHQLPNHDATITRIAASRRDKSLISRDESGNIQIAHMTTEKRLLSIPAEKPIRLYGLSTKGDLLLTLDSENVMTSWDLDIPHSEMSWKVLLGKVWYEHYDKPEYVWQSSASSDDYEPKMSLIPLIFGSLKGTIYAMIFAIPIALLGALYTSQFLGPRLRGIIKPAVEIMASIPSVVVGFLAALWLAPLIEDYVVGFFLSIIVIPITFALFLLLWQRADGSKVYRSIEGGYEFLLVIPVLLLGAYLSVTFAPMVESHFFEGNFGIWLYGTFEERYDQRNAIIIAFALGFAAIPIIFTMAEDALSSLPKGLVSASLALGASRWKTAWRVVLPSASPGIFAGVIIGFGRVIGETMIVLMATGNTPIIDASPFNGMRTLAANIAVEIPEAPVDGTLYRVLFLSAILLFLMTFLLNTAAELIRQRLRAKYARFQ